MASDAPKDPPTLPPGSGIYPYYDAHWHLRQIGVLHDGKDTPYDSRAWADAEARTEKLDNEARTRVVLIDNSVDTRHPNLDGVIDEARMIDFLSHPMGIFPNKDAKRDGLFAKLSKPRELFDGDGPIRPIFDAFWDRLTDPASDVAEAAQSVTPATAPTFSAHGTGMAGLIGARPVAEAPVLPRGYIGADDVVGTLLARAQTPLPYSGVDPYCRIVPVSTSFDEDPEQLILALLYAEIVRADVIVLARDFPDPRKFTARASPPDSHQPLDARPEQERILWDALAELFVAISRRRPIICAAGNGADEAAIYPASLAEPDNGIIPVGAVTQLGIRAGYSPRNPKVLVHAPSGDGERFDAAAVAIDTNTIDFDPAIYPRALVAEGGAIDTAPYDFRDLITTDVSGRFGYSGGLFREPLEGNGLADFGAYFTRFSGTSGAAAVAAGFLSLAYSAGRFPRPDEGFAGWRVKKVLESTLSAETAAAALEQEAPYQEGAEQPMMSAPPVQSIDAPTDIGGPAREAVAGLNWDALPLVEPRPSKATV